MRIAILGGSFDPPHLGHLQVAKQVKEIKIDEVWLMPCFLHPFGKKISPAIDRLNMTKLLEKGSIKVSDFEIKRKKISYTINTLESLRKKYSQNDFFWIISSSELKSFNKWKNWQKIIKNFGLIVFPRRVKNSTLKNLIKKNLDLPRIPENIIILESDKIFTDNISSGQIRKMVKEGKPVKHMINKKVEEYIIKNNLYGN